MAAILFYTSIKTRVRDQESLMVEFIRQGHSVFFLNQQPNKYLPDICKENNVSYYTVPQPKVSNSIIRTFIHSRRLVSFIRKNNITVVYSHLEPANFISVLSQYFVRADFIIVRHHHDLAQLAGFSNDLSYKLTYRLAKKIIVVSEATKKFVIKHEKISAGKIFPIRLGYDFRIFGNADDKKVSVLREKLYDKVKLIFVGRLDEYKRPQLAIKLLKSLHDRSILAHLLMLGTGNLLNELRETASNYNLLDSVDFLGYEDDVLTYLKAADWLIHPSISESSCVVIKEAGLVGLPVIACRSVGDFDEYLVNGKNSFLVNPQHYIAEATEIIISNSDVQIRQSIGKRLHDEIINRFDIKNLVKEYDTFNG